MKWYKQLMGEDTTVEDEWDEIVDEELWAAMDDY